MSMTAKTKTFNKGVWYLWFGRHYEAGHDGTVREEFNYASADSSYQFRRKDHAIEHLKQKRVEKFERDIKAIDRRFSGLRAKFQIATSWMRLHPRSQRIREAVRELKAKKQELQDQLNAPFEPKFTPLADDLKMPVLLEKHRPVYKVRSTYLDEGIEIEELRIGNRSVYKARAESEFDYSVTYSLEYKNGKRASYSFQYDHADVSALKIKTNSTGIALFLTREAAEKHAADLARKTVQKLQPYLK